MVDLSEKITFEFISCYVYINKFIVIWKNVIKIDN